MTSHIYLDKIDNLGSRERFGVMDRLVRGCLVVDLDTNVDYLVLRDAISATPNVPAYGSLPPGIPNLVLTERNPTVVDDRSVKLELIYEHPVNEGQNLNSPPLGIIMGEISCTLSQEETNKDKDGNDLFTEYHYPVDYLLDPTITDQTIRQGGVAQFQQPQKTLCYRGLFSTPLPWLIADGLNGHINMSPWSGRPAGEWLCTNVKWRLYDVSFPNRYFLEFSFQLKVGGWNPTIYFKDPNTGKPPPDLVEGTGYKTAEVYPETNFEAILGSRVQGG